MDPDCDGQRTEAEQTELAAGLAAFWPGGRVALLTAGVAALAVLVRDGALAGFGAGRRLPPAWALRERAAGLAIARIAAAALGGGA